MRAQRSKEAWRSAKCSQVPLLNPTLAVGVTAVPYAPTLMTPISACIAGSCRKSIQLSLQGLWQLSSSALQSMALSMLPKASHTSRQSALRRQASFIAVMPAHWGPLFHSSAGGAVRFGIDLVPIPHIYKTGHGLYMHAIKLKQACAA